MPGPRWFVHREQVHLRAGGADEGRESDADRDRSEKATKLAQKLGQRQTLTAVFPLEFWANLHRLGQPNIFLARGGGGEGKGATITQFAAFSCDALAREIDAEWAASAFASKHARAE